MFFFKPRQQNEELLPPPPPLPYEIEEDLGIEDFKKLDFTDEIPAKELMQDKKPKEILEAEEEIRNAIEKIKKKEKISFFRKFFPVRRKIKEDEDAQKSIVPDTSYLENLEKPTQIQETDEIFAIQSNIKKAKEALTNFNLKSAKDTYVEIMKIYTKMTAEEQAKVYHEIRELYSERKMAEGLKI